MRMQAQILHAVQAGGKKESRLQLTLCGDNNLELQCTSCEVGESDRMVTLVPREVRETERAKGKPLDVQNARCPERTMSSTHDVDNARCPEGTMSKAHEV